MKDYIVSARKYRPINFDSVVGQRALTTTLKNAIITGKLAHAYLFCGPRGVGKTTCARIFAKTINCLNLSAEGEACNECESCLAFNEQRSYNIHELDAASNNSVDDIRSLIEQVRIPPQIGKYKVFIIDEVHMLSPSAFNAFLKTLEEPPHHAIFILATTEKHKILPTILSRCQIYDFNRMNVNDTVEHLKYVAQKEGIETEPEALDIIAQKADGGMRDALSIFDQMVSFTGGQVTYQRVIENLNVLDYEYYFRITDMLLGNKVSDSMLLFNEILNKGFDGHHFITGLASHLRDLLVSRDASTLTLLEVSDKVKQRYSEQAQKCEPRFLYRAIKLCNDCDLNYRASKNKRLLVEITLIQVAQLTIEEQEVSGGRSPKKMLKPLFSQHVKVESSNPTTTKPESQTRPSAGNELPQQQASVANKKDVDNPQEQQGQRSPLFGGNSAHNQTRKIPTIKKGESIGISIRRPQPESERSAVAAPKQNATTQATPLKEVQENGVFDENDIRRHWMEFAMRLPIEENATAGRMKIMQPKLTNDTTFEVTVDNEMVAKQLQPMSAKIVSYIQQQLHNNTIKMEIRVSDDLTPQRAYNRSEQYKMMAEKNPALVKLKELFGLEFS